MPAQRALLIDADEEFEGLVRRTLRPLGFEVRASSDEDDWLLELETSPPRLVLVAVDHPERRGFSDFTKVRSVVRRVPVVLTTSTLSPDELRMHEKLKVHADAYLHKQSLDEESLREALAPWVEGRRDDGEAHPAATATRPGGGGDDWLDSLSREGLDPEIAAALESLLGTRNDSATPTERAVRDEVVARLEAEIERLREELADARREARSSPFSGDFLSLRQRESRRDSEIARLRTEIGERDARNAELTELIERLAQRLMPLTHERNRAREDAEELRSRIESAEAEAHRALAQLRREHQEEIARLETRHAAERAGFEKALEQAAQQHDTAMLSLQRLHAEELSQLRASHAALATTREREDEASVARAVAAERGRLQREVEQLKHAHAGELAALRARAADQLAELRSRHEETLASRQRSHQELLERSLAEQGARLDRRLRQIREQQLAELDAQSERHRAEIQAIRDEHARSLAQEAARIPPDALEKLESAGARALELVEQLATATRMYQGEKERADSLACVVRDAAATVQELLGEDVPADAALLAIQSVLGSPSPRGNR